MNTNCPLFWITLISTILFLGIIFAGVINDNEGVAGFGIVCFFGVAILGWFLAGNFFQLPIKRRLI